MLEHVTFTARPGQTTAFIGSTGSGKSTLINLIPRFYDVTGGRVLVDGVDVRDIPQKELRDAIGYVPQKGLLFSGTIASNLRYGDEDAPRRSCCSRAADVAQATEFISELEEGFDTEISQGGTNVSGGQRQRLSIARALVKKAPIYIFDDTFSALDFKTDAKLRKALARATPKTPPCLSWRSASPPSCTPSRLWCWTRAGWSASAPTGSCCRTVRPTAKSRKVSFQRRNWHNGRANQGPKGGRPRMMPGEKAKDFKGTMGKLLTYLGKFLPSIILCAGLRRSHHRLFHLWPEGFGPGDHQTV